jgi:hypothetical protein
MSHDNLKDHWSAICSEKETSCWATLTYLVPPFFCVWGHSVGKIHRCIMFMSPSRWTMGLRFLACVGLLALPGMYDIMYLLVCLCVLVGTSDGCSIRMLLQALPSSCYMHRLEILDQNFNLYLLLYLWSFVFEFTLKPHCHSFLGRVIKLRSGGSLASKHFVTVKYVPESFNKPNSRYMSNGVACYFLCLF